MSESSGSWLFQLICGYKSFFPTHQKGMIKAKKDLILCFEFLRDMKWGNKAFFQYRRRRGIQRRKGRFIRGDKAEQKKKTDQ